jgi:hypothetical protein
MLALVSLAAAASVTELPTKFRGDVTLGYAYDRLAGPLVETPLEGDPVEIATRAVQDHQLRYGFTFAAGPGIAVYAEIPHSVGNSVNYTSPRTMVYEPTSQSGTYVGTNVGADGAAIEGKGVSGVWLGIKGTPWNEEFRTRNGVTWLVEGALRTPDSSNLWTVTNGTRGAGPGGTAYRLHSAWSQTNGASSPYLAVTWTHENLLSVDTFAQDGTQLASGVQVDPADSLRIRFGTQNTASSNEASGALLRFDLRATVDYASDARVPGGIFLPNTLATTEGQSVQAAESLEGGAGLAILWRPMTYLEMNLHGDAAARLPQRIEHPYPVRTGWDTLHANVGLDMTVRVR